MPSSVISVRGLGKQYELGSAPGAFRYDALRDALTDAAAQWASRVRSFGRGGGENGKSTEFWALKDVSFDIAPGEVVGVIGRNGAGKSTLLKILSRVTRPTAGYAELEGRVGSLLEVGTGFHPELTGRENIFLNGAVLGMRRGEVARNFDAIVAFAGVERFLDTPVKRYSSGMYVRLAFAVAAHLETEILLVDEVLAVGDAEFQRKCLGKMQSVVREGRTILFVSHNMAAVKALCHRALLVHAGGIAADGPVDQVVDRYLAPSTATATGVVPDDAPRTGTGEARIRKVEMRDGDGVPVAQLYLGDRFSVAVTFEVQRSIGDAIVSVGISTLDGVRVTSSFSTDGGAATVNLQPGAYRAVLDLEVALLPRRYALDVALARTDGYEIDYVQRVLEFTALPVARQGRDGYPWQTVHGYVRPSGRWHVLESVG